MEEPHESRHPGPPGPPPPPTAFGAGGSGRSAGQLIGLVAVMAALGWGLMLVGRVAAGWAAGLLPYSVDQAIGEAASEGLVGDRTVCTNPVLVGAVEELVAGLAGGLDAVLQDLHVTVIDDEQVNAFALPGGRMFVHTGLLAAIESPEQLIGVLGHEVGHVVHRHGIRRIARALWVRVLVASVVGDIGGMGELMASSAAGVLSMSWDRDQERESDRFGVTLMQQVGYDAAPVPGFFDALPGMPLPEWLSTHPNSEGRAAELAAFVATLPAPSRPVAPPSLDRLKASCQP